MDRCPGRALGSVDGTLIGVVLSGPYLRMGRYMTPTEPCAVSVSEWIDTQVALAPPISPGLKARLRATLDAGRWGASTNPSVGLRAAIDLTPVSELTTDSAAAA